MKEITGNGCSAVRKFRVRRDQLLVEILKSDVFLLTLFRGYEDSFTHDLITIRAKKTCNLSYSHVDDELRNFVAILTDGKNNQNMLKKTFSSIARKDKERFQPDEHGFGISFDYGMILKLNEKNFKGLFYYEFGVPFPNDQFRIFSLTETEGDEKIKKLAKFLFQQFLEPIVRWKVSGHEDVFRYKIVMLKSDDDKDFSETENLNEMIVAICAMHYYKTVIGFSIGINTEWFEKIKQNR